tara:strand:- start:780 stop:1319 length:540 start_codon:yes stop_codon:yes gene_type:complete
LEYLWEILTPTTHSEVEIKGRHWYANQRLNNQVMLYQYKPTGGLVEVVSQHGEGIKMCLDANEDVLYADEEDLIPHVGATNEKNKNEAKYTAELEADGVKPANLTSKDTFPIDMRVNINNASARQIADSLPGVGLKTARDIKDLQTACSGEKFQKLEQLRAVKRVDWDQIFKENLVRVD